MRPPIRIVIAIALVAAPIPQAPHAAALVGLQALQALAAASPR